MRSPGARAAAVVVAWLSCAPLIAQESGPTLKVCADPNNLPFSHRNGDGFENRLAQIWARELGMDIAYTWFPQRRAFIRQTLMAKDESGAYKCDVVMGVPAGFERGIATRPIYRSTYAIAFLADGKLAGVESARDLIDMTDAEKANVRVAAFTPTPGTLWLSRYNLDQKLLAFPAMAGDPEEYPGMLIENQLMDGTVDAVLLWGPIAGYFAGKAGKPVRVVPLASEQGIRFHFAIAAGVRFGEGEFKQRLDAAMDATEAETAALLQTFGFPLVDEDGKSL